MFEMQKKLGPSKVDVYCKTHIIGLKTDQIVVVYT